MVYGQAGFFRDPPLACNWRFTLALCLRRFCLAFGFAPWNTQTITPILQAKVVLPVKIWRTFMVSETRFVILLPLETSQLDLDNIIKLNRGRNVGRGCTNY